MARWVSQFQSADFKNYHHKAIIMQLQGCIIWTDRRREKKDDDAYCVRILPQDGKPQ